MTQATTQPRDPALERLAEGVKAAQANWQAFLGLVATMPQYSLRNLLLIWLQKPDATLVQGFNNWKKLNRFVKKGEKGIQIYAPRVVKNNEGEAEPKGFHAVHVFDVSQTDGEPLPASAPREASDGTDDNAQMLFTALRAWLESQGCPVSFANLESKNANGVYYHKTNSIQIEEKSGDILRFGTLAHEAAHLLMHGGEEKDETLTKNLRELEAESTAAIVCQHFQIPRDHSYDYMAVFEATPEKVLACGERITKTAKKIIQAIEEGAA